MTKTLFIFPTIYEARAAFASVGKKPKVGDVLDIPSKGDTRVRFLVSGFGCDACKARMKEQLEKFSPDLVVLSGFGGACHDGFRNGDRVRDRLDIAPDADGVAAATRNALEKLEAAVASMDFARAGMASVTDLAGADKKAELKAAGYGVVEMEIDMLRDIVRNRPCAIAHLRWISDTADCKVPMWFFTGMMNYKTGEMKISPWLFLRMLFTNPSGFGELKKFASELAPTRKKYDSDIMKIIGALNS